MPQYQFTDLKVQTWAIVPLFWYNHTWETSASQLIQTLGIHSKSRTGLGDVDPWLWLSKETPEAL